jgi:subtilase family serine protease
MNFDRALSSDQWLLPASVPYRLEAIFLFIGKNTKITLLFPNLPADNNHHRERATNYLFYKRSPLQYTNVYSRIQCLKKAQEEKRKHMLKKFILALPFIEMKPPGIGPRVFSSTPYGLGPNNLQNAYHLPSATAGKGKTVAIVDAYDDPTAETDLAAYRSTYGLPACTTANGCFKKVDQQGGSNYPQADSDWGGEISLDLDMV